MFEPCFAAQNIFADAGVEWKWYRYFEPKTVGLDFEGMMEDLRGAPEGSVVILHGLPTSSPSSSHASSHHSVLGSNPVNLWTHHVRIALI